MVMGLGSLRVPRAISQEEELDIVQRRMSFKLLLAVDLCCVPHDLTVKRLSERLNNCFIFASLPHQISNNSSFIQL